MIKCLLSRPGLIAGPLHSVPLQINFQSIPRLNPISTPRLVYHFPCRHFQYLLFAFIGPEMPIKFRLHYYTDNTYLHRVNREQMRVETTQSRVNREKYEGRKHSR